MRAFVPYRSYMMMAAAILGDRIALLLLNRVTSFGRWPEALSGSISGLPQKLRSSKARHRKVRSECILDGATRFRRLPDRDTSFGRLLKALGDRISRLPQKLRSGKARHRSVRSGCMLNRATRF